MGEYCLGVFLFLAIIIAIRKGWLREALEIFFI
jgi:hypothetical protein